MRHVAKVQFRFQLPPLQQFGFLGVGHPTYYRELEVFGRSPGRTDRTWSPAGSQPDWRNTSRGSPRYR